MSALLLDTHALLWAALEPRRLGGAARKALQRGGPLLLSAASLHRLLVAQARVLGAALVSKDAALDAYGVARIWS